ncbi:MAG: hypothetical protein EAX86_11700 [Candidatus Heimdallarchaeota archaeon]|nr:hypothetical protein [Candidatus Heimdallarchaeota archaeon]
MVKESREVEIETLKTPKGEVPTIKGLETAINLVKPDSTDFEKDFSRINEQIVELHKIINKQSDILSSIGNSIANLVNYMAKKEKEVQELQSEASSYLMIEKADLVALKEELAIILEKLHDQIDKDG